jgi:hypothetical protein
MAESRRISLLQSFRIRLMNSRFVHDAATPQITLAD